MDLKMAVKIRKLQKDIRVRHGPAVDVSQGNIKSVGEGGGRRASS